MQSIRKNNFPKTSRLISSDIKQVLETGNLVKNGHFIAWIIPNSNGYSRIGFVFSKKKVAKAIWRNKLRRMGKEKFRKAKQYLFYYDVVIGIKSPVLNVTNLKNLNSHYDELFTKIFLFTSRKSN